MVSQLKALEESCREQSKDPIVFGEGNIHAKIMLIGEAPGAKEVELGHPFVGKAGKNLEEFLDILNMKREDLYISNVVKIRPYKVNEKTGRKSNRTPTQKEIDVYKEYLFEEIKIVQPKIVVTLGNVPLKTILEDKKATIGQKHGQAINKGSYSVFALYHPASIIYRRELKEVYLEDLRKLKNFKDQIKD